MTRAATNKPADRQRGQILPFFALAIVVIIGFAAVTIDYGYWLLVRRDYQNVADGAALAGARFLTRPLSAACIAGKSKPVCAREAAWTYLNQELGLSIGPATQAADNVVASSVGDFTITVSSPASAAGSSYPGSATGSATIYVAVSKESPTYLSRIWGRSSQTVGAWATAGSRSGRFAVITLRRIGDAGPGDTRDIDIAGTSDLVVRNGDVGGNWGLAISGSGARLVFQSTTGDSYGAFLADPRQSAPTCCSWNPSQVVGGNVEYLAEVPDPNYPLPPGILLTSPGPSTQVPNGCPLPGGCNYGSGSRTTTTVAVNAGGPAARRAPGEAALVGGVLTCDANSPKIGPGYYTSITIDAGKCLILDPTMRHTSVESGTPDVATPVLVTQSPGIFYVNGSITVNSGGMLVGDGVTLVIRPGDSPSTSTKLDIRNNALVAVNVGATPGVSARTLGAWYWDTATQSATSPYSWGGATWSYQGGLEADENKRGIAIYVPKRADYMTGLPYDDNTDVLNNLSSGAGMVWKGVVYGPHDNITFAGQVGYDAVGQMVGWTVKFTGGTSVTQDYRGPDQGIPFLIEPYTNQR